MWLRSHISYGFMTHFGTAAVDNNEGLSTSLGLSGPVLAAAAPGIPPATTARAKTDSAREDLANAPPPLFFGRRGVRLQSSPRKPEGAERRKALSSNVTPRGRLAKPAAGRRARILRCVRLPALHWRHLQAGAHVGPAINPRPRFLGRGQPRPVPVQRAPRRAPIVAPERSPGAARVRGYEPRPQGPHPIPLK